MFSLIERIKKGRLKDFPGGVHPPGRKALSVTHKVMRPALPERLFIPLKQHSGEMGTLLVAVGDSVLKGQPLTQAHSNSALPVHAPTSGSVVAVTPHISAHPSGIPEMTLVLAPDGQDNWCERHAVVDYNNHSPSVLATIISNAGISGLGGAGFPTHRKLQSKQPLEFLIINGVECEPYITADDTIMQQEPEGILDGIKILQHILKPKHIIIAIEDNKPDALAIMREHCKDTDFITVSIPTKYPAGGEKQLIQVLTGRQVPSRGLSSDVGVTMFNVGTCFAIAKAVLEGIPLIERIVTITGEGVVSPQNVWALIGTPVADMLAHAQESETRGEKVVMGGPMMGFAVQSSSVPVIKTTNCILVPAVEELNSGEDARECIRCSACADACPVQLLPQQLYWHSKAQEWEKTQHYDLFDCIECGACAYVCPSEIPLVQYYRNAKQEIRNAEQEKRLADHAKQRFEARNQRLEREQAARVEKQRVASEKRRQAMNEKGSDAKDKIAAALARVKAKQSSAESTSDEVQSDGSTNTTASNSKVAAAVARAKAKKLAQQQASQSAEESRTNQHVPSDDNKARVADAIARAKAKKLAQQQTSDKTDTPAETSAELSANSTLPSPENEKKARVAAAVARAKAKKLAQQPTTDKADTPAETSAKLLANSTLPSPEDEKKARVAAAVARAKAKKLALQQATDKPDIAAETLAEPLANSVLPSPDDEKKARVAAAVTRAKAKKLAQQKSAASDDKQSAETSKEQSATTNASSPEDDKKARVAAAVARAKAKKLAKQQNQKDEQ